MRPCALQSSSTEPRGIGRNGSQAAKSNFALPGAGGSAGVRWRRAERAKASAEDFGGYADAGEPGVVHQQQWKGRAHRALRDASATGYVCGKGARDRGTGRQERASDPGIGCKRCGGETLRGEGKAPARRGRFAGSQGGRQNGRRGESGGEPGKSASRARPAAEKSRSAAAADRIASRDAG